MTEKQQKVAQNRLKWQKMTYRPPIGGVHPRILASQLDLVLEFPTRIWVFRGVPRDFDKNHEKRRF
jgi:hypothetical protein